MTAVMRARAVVVTWMQETGEGVGEMPASVSEILDDAQRLTTFAINRTTKDSLYTVWPEGRHAYGVLADVFVHEITNGITGGDTKSVRKSYDKVLRVLAEGSEAERRLERTIDGEASRDGEP